MRSDRQPGREESRAGERRTCDSSGVSVAIWSVDFPALADGGAAGATDFASTDAVGLRRPVSTGEVHFDGQAAFGLWCGGKRGVVCVGDRLDD
jgi:hypothetical protein